MEFADVEVVRNIRGANDSYATLLVLAEAQDQLAYKVVKLDRTSTL